jgi:hypothetical protein
MLLFLLVVIFPIKLYLPKNGLFLMLAAGRSGKKDDHGERKNVETEVTAG